ncbi:radical SAM/SPASM domain-containing protein [Chloroflexota bacterium]
MALGFTLKIEKYAYLARSYMKFFLTGKVLSYPLVIQIQTKSLCNGHCIFCPYPEVSKRLEHGTMTWELFKNITDELFSIKYPVMLVFELHNEPLLDDRIFDFIKYVKSRNREIGCFLVSNGQVIDNFSLQEINQSDIDGLIVSLNAHSQEMFQKLNSGLNYYRIIRNIHLLISVESLKRKLMISFVLNQETAKEIPQALDYWKSMDVKTRIIELNNRAGTIADYNSMTLRSSNINFSLTEIIGRYLIDCTIGIIGCYETFYHMNILYNGDVIICCDDWNRATIVGNVRDKTIKQVWNSPPMNEVRRLILKKKYDQISSCRNCSKAK